MSFILEPFIGFSNDELKQLSRFASIIGFAHGSVSKKSNNIERDKRLKVKLHVFISPKQVTSELRSITCRMESHSVTCHPTRVIALSLTLARQPTPQGWKAELTCVDGLPVSRQSPIQAVTVLLVEQLR